MSADNWTPKRWTRRRAFMAGGTVAAGLAAGALGTALALAGTPVAKAPAASDTSHTAISKAALTAISQSAGSDPNYYAYLSAAGGDEVVEVNVAAASIAGTFSADSAEGAAAAPDGSEIYIAETGQYSVLAVNPATKAQQAIEVGSGIDGGCDGQRRLSQAHM